MVKVCEKIHIEISKDFTDELVIITDPSLVPPKIVLVKYAIINPVTSEKSYRAISRFYALFDETALKFAFSTIYSTVEINYNPSEIRSVTSQDIDRPYSGSLRSSKDIATEIKQLLIDIQTLDATDLNNWVGSHPREAPPLSVVDQRIGRFKNAFSRVFEDMNFKRIATTEKGKDVVFEKNGREVPIAALSSGEKQIVFRGAFLLSNQKNSKGHIILIDEPEISMHPVWQKKILQFYKALFTEDGVQTSQIIVATHSPFIIHNRERFNDKVLVFKRDGASVSIDTNPSYPACGEDKLIEAAFNTNEFSSELPIVFVEGDTDEKYLKKYLELTGQEGIFDVRWIGHNTNKSAENTGDKALSSCLKFARANPECFRNHVILLYDSDTNHEKFDEGLIHSRTMPYNDKNLHYKIGVENMLAIPDGFQYDDFISESDSTDNYGVSSKIRKLDKKKLCDHICDDDFRARVFLANMSDIIDILKECIKTS